LAPAGVGSGGVFKRLRANPCETELGKILQDQGFFRSDQTIAPLSPLVRRQAGAQAQGGPIVCERAIDWMHLMT
jgi:hypothetical protein